MSLRVSALWYAEAMGCTLIPEDAPILVGEEGYWIKEPSLLGARIKVTIDLPFLTECLELTEKVDCHYCQGTGDAHIGNNVPKCKVCKGTGKITRYLIDREKYYEALLASINDLNNNYNWYRHDMIADAMVLSEKEMHAIHNVTPDNRVEAMITALELR